MTGKIYIHITDYIYNVQIYMLEIFSILTFT